MREKWCVWENCLHLGYETIGRRQHIAQGLFGKLLTIAYKWPASGPRWWRGTAIHEHLVDINDEGWCYNTWLTTERIKCGTDSFLSELFVLALCYSIKLNGMMSHLYEPTMLTTCLSYHDGAQGCVRNVKYTGKVLPSIKTFTDAMEPPKGFLSILWVLHLQASHQRLSIEW